MFTFVYPCLVMFSYVYYVYSFLFTYVYPCILVFTYVYTCLRMLSIVNMCWPMFTTV